MDKSYTRRGKTCWYRLEGNEDSAINDCYLLESCVYRILNIYLINHKNYSKIIKLFHDISLKTELGQLLDLNVENSDTLINFDQYTLEKFNSISENKTAYYTFFLPIMGSFYLSVSDVNDIDINEIKDICIKMGIYFQAQDDYLDCYGDEKIIGKIGTDIEDGKCTWLITTVLEDIDENDKLTIKENYGINNKFNVDKKNL